MNFTGNLKNMPLDQLKVGITILFKNSDSGLHTSRPDIMELKLLQISKTKKYIKVEIVSPAFVGWIDAAINNIYVLEILDKEDTQSNDKPIRQLRPDNEKEI